MKNHLFLLLLLSGTALAQSKSGPHYVDRPISTRPVKFGWKSRSPQDKDDGAVAYRIGGGASKIGTTPLILQPGSALSIKSEWCPTFYAGVLAEKPVRDYLYVQPQLNFLRASVKATDSAASLTQHLHYFNLAIMAKVKPVGGLSLFIGPELSYLAFTGKNENSAAGIPRLQKSYFKPLGVYYIAGVGLGFPAGFGFDLSYRRSAKSPVRSQASALQEVTFGFRYYFYDF